VSRPLAVAVTGGIGAGKSEALRAFARHGAAVVSSDEIVHHLLATDDELKRALVERFGERILGADGRPDRGAIAQIVFADSEELGWLESLLHPIVSAEYMTWRARLGQLPQPPEVCVTEVPLLFEAGAQERFDRVVVVTAPEALRGARRQVRADERDARLLPEEEKVRRADHVYVNEGTIDELDAWVEGLMRELTAR
jgi:dephospho-CoA kinase